MADQATPAIPPEILSLVRHAATFVGGYLAAKGFIGTDLVPEVAGVLVSIVTLCWSIADKRIHQEALAKTTADLNAALQAPQVSNEQAAD